VAFAPGDILDRYALFECVGRGGQAEVWKAADRGDGSWVALKLVGMVEDERVNERARREARGLGRMTHPSLLRCLALFEDPNRRVIGLALEWVNGADLDRLRGVLSLDQRRCALNHVIAALAELHRTGVVHRDVKLSNVLIGEHFLPRPEEPTNVKLADLGIASVIGNPSPLTNTGFLVGTVSHLPPELLDPSSWASPVSRPSQDVFSFGIAAWRLLFDTHPTGLPHSAGLLDYAQAYRDFAEVPELWLPPAPGDDALLRAIKRCLRLNPAERPQDAAQVAREMAEGR
jgi:serine/threonine protein kinase